MSTARRSYHHGDLAAALVEAGLELTRTGGPAALSIREATRRVGVAPNAAYRHFADRDALRVAVAQRILADVAARMRLDAPPTDTRDAAIARLHAVGMGYIAFALAEPGWFAVAFFGEPARSTPAAPYRALVAALDGLVDAGALAPDRRAGAEWPCFSAVHGFAELALHGPLRGRDPAELTALAERTVAAIIAGLLT